MPIVPVQERIPRCLGMAHDTHGILPQDMALFHLFQDIRSNADRDAVIKRFCHVFPGITPEHLGSQCGTSRSPGRQPASFCGRRRMKGFTREQQIEHMQGRLAFRGQTFPTHDAGCDGVVLKLTGPIRRNSRSKLRIGIPCQPSVPTTGRRFAGQTRLLKRDAPFGKETPHRPQPYLVVTGGTGIMNTQCGDAAATGFPAEGQRGAFRINQTALKYMDIGVKEGSRQRQITLISSPTDGPGSR